MRSLNFNDLPAAQSVAPGPAAYAPPGILLEMQDRRPCSRPAEAGCAL